jgi:hypothetical protein
MATSTETVQPVKGMVWKHAKRKNYRGEPVVLTVTSLQKSPKGVLVYSKTEFGDRVKTPLDTFSNWVAEVVSMPEPVEPPLKLSDAQCAALHLKAHEAGLEAGLARVPTPMVVQQHEDPFDDSSPVEQEWIVGGGVCGFAWVVTRGDTSFGRWARRKGGWDHNFGGGVALWVRHFGQSMEQKEAYASAYAAVLREAGVKAYGNSRMD